MDEQYSLSRLNKKKMLIWRWGNHSTNVLSLKDAAEES